MPTASDSARYALIPWPRSLEARPGEFLLGGGTRAALVPDGDQALVALGATLGLPTDGDAGAAGTVTLTLDPQGPAGDESYALDISPERVDLRARNARGLFYGVQTLRQLLAASTGGRIPAARIEDAPRFRHRGLHLDVGRHYFPLEFIKKYIDVMSVFKLNTFHWHLTEDQGWRLEIKKYPKLTEVGAWRKETIVGHARKGPKGSDGTKHGGFYTQDEAREVVAYARARAITVIPEIEMPGHALAAIASYPELAGRPGPFEVRTTWGISDEVMTPSEFTFTFLEDVLREVMSIFPGTYIHIGGDEAPKTRWRESALAQQIITREGLGDEDGLQSWFIRRIEAFLNANGRRLVGWDEILEGGLAPDATVMSWRGTAGGVAAAKEGHDVVMCPQEDLYFDHYQADPAQEPLAIGGLTPLEDTYRYEPIPAELAPDQARHVIGAQGCVWTEYMPTSQVVEYMAYPRALALAELAWSPRDARDWDSFRTRLRPSLELLDGLGVGYRRPD